MSSPTSDSGYHEHRCEELSWDSALMVSRCREEIEIGVFKLFLDDSGFNVLADLVEQFVSEVWLLFGENLAVFLDDIASGITFLVDPVSEAHDESLLFESILKEFISICNRVESL